MTLLHFLQRILKTLPMTLSSEIEYLAWQASQTIFIVKGSDPPRGHSLEKSSSPFARRHFLVALFVAVFFVFPPDEAHMLSTRFG